MLAGQGMQKYHHDMRDYDTANSEAAAFGRSKFEAWINKGKPAAADTITQAITARHRISRHFFMLCSGGTSVPMTGAGLSTRGAGRQDSTIPS